MGRWLIREGKKLNSESPSTTCFGHGVSLTDLELEEEVALRVTRTTQGSST
jgi:hypothetical protein